MATIIYSDGQEREAQPNNGNDFTLDELMSVVGGHIEIVNMPDTRIMVINEEGKLLKLPRNDKATQLAGLPTPKERREAIREYKRLGFNVISGLDPNEEDYIAGTVLVCLSQEVK